MGRWTVFKSASAAAIAAFVAAIGGSAFAIAGPQYGIGTPVTEAQIAPWNIDVNGLTGAGLPPGHGSVAEGTKLWEAKCAVCHGEFGEGAGKFPVLAGGMGTLKDERPEKTVGSYWPFAPTLFDYIKRAMPFPAPQSLTDAETYALTAYILNLNDIVPKDAVMDAKSLAAVRMPNRDGFVQAAWDTKNTPCMTNCAIAPVKITSDLVNLRVTPDEKEVGNVGSLVDRGPIADDLEPTVAAPAAAGRAAPKKTEAVFPQVASIIAQRCTVCHSMKPTQPGFSSAPMGVKFDTPVEIKAQATQIKAQSVASHQMPLGNMTHMTDKERAVLGRWVAAGAPLK